MKTRWRTVELPRENFFRVSDWSAIHHQGCVKAGLSVMVSVFLKLYLKKANCLFLANHVEKKLLDFLHHYHRYSEQNLQMKTNDFVPRCLQLGLPLKTVLDKNCSRLGNTFGNAELIIWLRRTHFRQQCRKFSAKVQKSFLKVHKWFQKVKFFVERRF